ncbi:MFS transporter [Planctomycetes bacterium K23_9]|uniref:Regulatory protein UhpC n=1 Tax=Stieleria marina TaxID=1930275 RepID=A0A517P3G4_9BACT|nr:Regulatory protein UhpC [Planctomycetes bacterium K23_9]
MSSALEDKRWLSDPRAKWQITILLTMYIGYAAFMLCRNTLGAASPAMMEDPTIAMDKASFGRLMSWHSAGAIAGKLVTGIAADLLGGRRMFMIALSLTAVANIGFALSSSLVMMGVFNFFGQFFKAGGWPAMTKLVADWYPQARYGQVWSIISTSSRVGTITAGVLLGFLLGVMPWRMVFVVSAVMTAFAVIGAFFLLRDRPESVGLLPLQPDETPLETSESVGHPFDDLSIGQVCYRFIASGRFWLICLSICFLTILMDFINFIPIYLSEVLEIPANRASMAGSAFPTGMFLALIATSFLYDRVTKKNLIYVLGGLLAGSCVCVVALWNLGNLPVSPTARMPLAIGLIFVFGFAISPAYYIPMSIFAVKFGGKHAGFLVALIDVCGYSGAWAFNFFGGSIAEDYGWSVFLIGLLSITVVATLSMVSFLTIDYRKQ